MEGHKQKKERKNREKKSIKRGEKRKGGRE